MPWQLIYTSAPRGLISGQSGFCTVARSADLREALAQRLEQLSSYQYVNIAAAASPGQNPVVHACRLLDVRGTKYHVLTRIHPCGLDFTARTNHLAHHLVFHAHELAQLPSPAAILRFWPGWLEAWSGEPRLLPDAPLAGFAAAAKYCLPAENWLRVTGDAGRAAALLDSEQTRHSYLLSPARSESQVLDFFCESLQLLNINGQYALRPWRHTFTTFLQSEDNPADFQWRVCQENTTMQKQIVERSLPLVPLARLRVPANSLAKTAREGHKPPSAASGPIVPDKVTLRDRDELPPETKPGEKPDPWKDFDDGSGPGDTRPVWPRFFSGNTARVLVFCLVLGAVVAAKFVLPKHPTLPAPFVDSSPATPATPPAAAPTSVAPLYHRPAPDSDELRALNNDGPVYVFPTADFASVEFPPDTSLRLQKLLNGYDALELLPDAIHLSVNTDEWDFSDGAPATVQSRQARVLSATTPSGLAVSLDYAAWKNSGHGPVIVRTTFPSPPRAVSLHFAVNGGDPFRLLLVNQNNAPAPLTLGLHWLRPEAGSLAGSLQAPLAEHLFGTFFIPVGWRWELRPFVAVPNRHEVRYVYQNWASEDLPADGDELGFTAARARLAAHVHPLRDQLDQINVRLTAQLQKAAGTVALGSKLGLTNALLSFSTYTNNPTAGDFFSYLNALRKKTQLAGWPRLAEDDEDNVVAAKFQQILDACVARTPDLKSILAADPPNYFNFTWQALKDTDRMRQEEMRVAAEVDKIRAQLALLPESLGKVSHVGLYLVDPASAGLEMIRFEPETAAR